MPTLTERTQRIAEERLALYRALAADEDVQYTPRAVLDLLTEAELALQEQATIIAHYKGMLAARDGREVILTFDRIGPQGVPTNHEDGTRLKCTDSDREWVLHDGEWVELA